MGRNQVHMAVEDRFQLLLDGRIAEKVRLGQFNDDIHITVRTGFVPRETSKKAEAFDSEGFFKRDSNRSRSERLSSLTS